MCLFFHHLEKPNEVDIILLLFEWILLMDCLEHIVVVYASSKLLHDVKEYFNLLEFTSKEVNLYRLLT